MESASTPRHRRGRWEHLDLRLPPDPQTPPRKRFVILDRDGTLIVEKNYLSSPEGVELLRGAASALKRLRDAGLGLVLITNQSGIGRGYFTSAQADAVHARMLDLLRQEGAGLDGIYICPHAPDDRCACRKPKTALLMAAARDFGFDPQESFVVGDKDSDVELGRGCGAQTILVRTGYGREHLAAGRATPDFVCNDMAEAADVIESALEKVPSPASEG